MSALFSCPFTHFAKFFTVVFLGKENNFKFPPQEWNSSHSNGFHLTYYMRCISLKLMTVIFTDLILFKYSIVTYGNFQFHDVIKYLFFKISLVMAFRTFLHLRCFVDFIKLDTEAFWMLWHAFTVTVVQVTHILQSFITKESYLKSAVPFKPTTTRWNLPPFHAVVS